MTTLTNAEACFEAALNAIRARGVHLRMNVMECCRSCVNWEKLELPSVEAVGITPVLWHFGGQGNELVWQNGQPFFLDTDFGRRRAQFGGRDGRLADRVYFNHFGPDLEAAQAAAEVFRGEGFEVEWDGTDGNSVQVLFS